MITERDRKFIRTKMLPYFGIKALNIDYSSSLARYPDIWVSLDRVPIITVTETWRRKSERQRHVELVHESLHIKGLQHGKYGGLDFNTKPALDSYSKKVYRDLIRVMG